MPITDQKAPWLFVSATNSAADMCPEQSEEMPLGCSAALGAKRPNALGVQGVPALWWIRRVVVKRRSRRGRGIGGSDGQRWPIPSTAGTASPSEDVTRCPA